ncbi:restriction endonuclease subunit S [Prevotella jejuni]|jgi:restriction endonuclease, S subunit
MREDWDIRLFKDVFDLQMGKTPDRKNFSLFEGDNTWVSIKDLDGKYISSSKECISDEAAKNIKLVKRGTVIMSFKLTVGKTAIAGKDLYTNEAIMAFNLRNGYDIDASFLYYYLMNYRWEGSNKAVMGITLNKATISKHKIAIPPKPTQLSIVTELDKLNELILIKKEQLKDYDTLAQSIFYEMFGDPVVNEKGWEVMSLGDICEITSSKRVFANEYVDMGVPFYRSKEVIEKSKQLPISVELYISESHYDKIKSSFGVPQIGDILVTAVGTIGKIWVVDTNEPFYFKDGNLVWLRKIKGVHSEYFRYSLFYLIDEYKKVNANGAAYNALTISKLKLMLCPLPPLSLQQSFAHKIEQIERQKAAVQSTITDLETLLAARMQYWFD